MTTPGRAIRRKRPWLNKTIVGSIVLIGVIAMGAGLSLAIRDARNAARKAVIM